MDHLKPVTQQGWLGRHMLLICAALGVLLGVWRLPAGHSCLKLIALTCGFISHFELWKGIARRGTHCAHEVLPYRETEI